MSIEQVIFYVLHTPHNTNKTILKQMLKQLIIDHGGSLEPNDPGNDDIIYDGGVEA